MRTMLSASAHHLLGGVLVVCFFALSSANGLRRVEAQTPARTPRFEVASIRRNLSGEGPGLQQPVTTQQHRLTARNVTVRDLIRFAYRHQYQPVSLIKGGPDWLDSERFDLHCPGRESIRCRAASRPAAP